MKTAAKPKAPLGKGAVAPRSKSHNRSLREWYDEACREVGVHPNSELLHRLPDKLNTPLESDTLDLSRNYVGDKGLGPVLIVVKHSPALKHLVLANNGLRNNGIRILCEMAAKHPGLSSIDVSDNYISEGAGVALLKLLEDNRRIAEIGIVNTRIDVNLVIQIKDKANENASLMAVGSS